MSGSLGASPEPRPQSPACDRCSQGVMDAENPHMWGDCRCVCHSSRYLGPCDVTDGAWACVFQRDHAGPHRNSDGVCIGPMVACYVPPGQTMYEVIWEWLRENNPAALELCPYKVTS